MIKSIEIKNFKSIKTKYFPLRNLNVLLGLNGMGKSTFIQSLLLLKQSQNIRNGRIDLNGVYTKIGSTKDALYQYSKQSDLAFEIIFDNKERLNLEFEYKMESDFFQVKSTSIITGNENLYRVLVGAIEGLNNRLHNNREIVTDSLLSPDLVTTYLKQNSIELINPTFENIGDLSSLSVLKQSLFTNNFQYLNASRIDPTSVNQKNYSSVIDTRNVGSHGEFTAHFIEVYFNDELSFEKLLHKDSRIKDSVTGKELVNTTLINQINLWMGEISPGVNIRTTSISSDYVLLEYVFKQRNFGNTNRYKPENVGFGISYVLPVVTSLLAARQGELIIIENPESHIHPRGQVELGRLIALTAMNVPDVQIIIETHSDHILNGIRVAVKEGDISKDKVVAFYFDKVFADSEQYSQITNIEIDQNGELSDYPKHMLDEWSNQLLKLI